MTAADLPARLPDTLNVSAAAQALIDVYADADCTAGERAAACLVWQALTGAPDVVAGIAYAALARDAGPVSAHTAPF